MRRNKFCIVFVVLIAIVAGACSKRGQDANSNKQAGNGPINVKTQAAFTEEIPTYLEASGSLISDAESNVAPTVGGKIVSVHFDVGSYVQKGNPLVTLDASDANIRLQQSLASVGQAQAQVKQAQAGVQQAIANLRQAQAKLNVGDGGSFNINNFSQVISIKAQLDLAEKELLRYERLLVTGDVSRSAYDRAKAQRDQLVGQLTEARSNAAVTVKSINIAEKGVGAAQAQEGTAKAALATAQTQVEQARKGVSDNVIYAPISGYISVRNADPGEYVSPNQPGASVATILRTSTLRLKIDIPEQAISDVGVGQGVSAQVASYPDRKFAGTIVRVLPNVKSDSRTLTVEAEIQNGDGALKPGEFATVRITQNQSVRAVMVPVSALRTTGDKSVVFVVKDGIANERAVQLGLLEGDNIEIKQGVAENEMVIISDLSTLQDGAIVQQQAS